MTARKPAALKFNGQEWARWARRTVDHNYILPADEHLAARALLHVLAERGDHCQTGDR